MIASLYSVIYESILKEHAEEVPQNAQDIEADDKTQAQAEEASEETVESKDIALKLSPNMVLEIEDATKEFTQIVSEMLAETNIGKDTYEKFKAAQDKIKNLLEACEVRD